MEKAASPGDAEGILLQQYPSPAADGEGIAGYYDGSSLTIHQLDEPSMEQPQLKNEAPLSPAPLDSRPSIVDETDELQLAARLSDSLAPMMMAAAAVAQSEAASLTAHSSHEPAPQHSEAQMLEKGDEPAGEQGESADQGQVLARIQTIGSQAEPPEGRDMEADTQQLPSESQRRSTDNPVEPVANQNQPAETRQPTIQEQAQDDLMEGSNLTAVEATLQEQPISTQNPAESTQHGLPLLPIETRGLGHSDQSLHVVIPPQHAPLEQQEQQQQQQQQHPPPPPPTPPVPAQLLQPQQSQQSLHQQHHQQHSLPQANHPQAVPGPPRQPPPLHYDQAQQPQMQLPPHLQMTYVGAHEDNTVPPRKRSKVSRACDECRRKKVKCDAISETGESACSNCRRSQIRCDFSRIPQKRGPSKGYIKELADRINSIEGKLGSQALAGEFMDLAGAPRRESSDPYSPSAPLNESAKRPFSSISGDSSFTSTPVASKPPGTSGWSAEPRPSHSHPPQPPTPAAYKAPYSLNNLAPRLAPAPAPTLVSDPQTPSRPPPVPVQNAASHPVAGAPVADAPPQLTYRDIDDNVFHGYLTIIHPTFPLLASVKTVVQSNLAQCPPVLQDAFLEALVSTMHSFHAMPPGVAAGDARAANRLLAEWESAGGPQGSYMAELVQLQTLLLLAIEADNHGPAAVRGQHGGPSKTSFLARAVAVAYSMSLRSAQITPDSWPEPESDPESQEKVALRAWWSLVALDRFNAVGTAQALLIPQSSIHVTSTLRSLLGEAGFQFIKLCYVLGHYVETFLTSSHPLTTPPGTSPLVLSSALSVGLEIWRMDFPPTITPKSHPVLHFAFWHCRLLSYLFTPSSQSTEVLWAAKGLLDDLTANHLALSPLNHNVASLVGLCLAELATTASTREEARDLIASELMSGNMAPSTWDNFIRDKIAAMDAEFPATSESPSAAAAAGDGVETTASQSLQHLADLAAAATTGPAATASAAAAAVSSSSSSSGGSLSNGDAGEAKATADAEAAGSAKPPPPRPRGPAENYENLGFDPRPMLRSGYLNAVGTAATTTA